MELSLNSKPGKKYLLQDLIVSDTTFFFTYYLGDEPVLKVYYSPVIKKHLNTKKY